MIPNVYYVPTWFLWRVEFTDSREPPSSRDPFVNVAARTPEAAAQTAREILAHEFRGSATPIRWQVGTVRILHAIYGAEKPEPSDAV